MKQSNRHMPSHIKIPDKEIAAILTQTKATFPCVQKKVNRNRVVASYQS